MTKIIVKVADAAMRDAMNGEIELIIKSKLEGEINDTKIEVEIKSQLANDTQNMGWQKRSMDKAFDSISAYAYMIGCLSGKMVRRDVRQIKCKHVKQITKMELMSLTIA